MQDATNDARCVHLEEVLCALEMSEGAIVTATDDREGREAE